MPKPHYPRNIRQQDVMDALDAFLAAIGTPLTSGNVYSVSINDFCIEILTDAGEPTDRVQAKNPDHPHSLLPTQRYRINVVPDWSTHGLDLWQEDDQSHEDFMAQRLAAEQRIADEREAMRTAVAAAAEQ